MIQITECPRKCVTPDIWEMIRLSDWATKGNLPLAGGVLNQTVSFNESHGEISSLNSLIRLAQMKRD